MSGIKNPFVNEKRITEAIEIHPDADSEIIWSNTPTYAVPAFKQGNKMVSVLVDILNDTQWDNDNVCKFNLSQITKMMNHYLHEKVKLKQQCLDYHSRGKSTIYLQKNTQKNLENVKKAMKNLHSGNNDNNNNNNNSHDNQSQAKHGHNVPLIIFLTIVGTLVAVKLYNHLDDIKNEFQKRMALVLKQKTSM